ncbi:GNAT family N-acetyltransferase [Herbiconiux daphne]|uniref:GNAT family N-acetyltransferase n=1 Tax=Herbiconiux daphne TaxID=2970914 RepID=A0ABT2H2D1_9MICO|nr:GNAT family N-acetyltransferase [Herbiconiux daphne]MCS5734072.1 GNAT family N-acetyltransferase [Herbiconiux daphne]
MAEVHIEPWADGDRWLLDRANTPEMTDHLGRPETIDELDQRHAKYLRYWQSGEARMFRIVRGDEPLGGIGWWSSRWGEVDVHETGWFVLPEAQGRGVASAAVQLVIGDARSRAEHDLLIACPEVGNVASNALCARSGFTLRGTEELPFRGTTLHTNVWGLDLRG